MQAEAEAVAPDDTPQETPEADNDLQKQPMISIDRLRADPNNPRENLDLNDGFCGSIEVHGVLVPLLIRQDPDDPSMFMIIEGHRRYHAARKVGRAVVPYTFVAADMADKAAAADVYLKMYVTNSGEQRVNHTPYEQLTAINLASRAGASASRISKATGLKVKQVRAAQKAGTLNPDVTARAREIGRELRLDHWGLLAEFEDDEEALNDLLSAIRLGRVDYTVERLRRQRLQATEQARVLAELEAAGVAVTDDLPFGALELGDLRTGVSEGEPGAEGSAGDEPTELTPELHASCPGQGAYFRSFKLTEPVHYCADPEAYGHGYRSGRDAKRLRLRAELLAAGRTVTEDVPADAAELRHLRHGGRELSVQEHRSCPGSGVALRRYGAAATEYCRDFRRHGHKQLSKAQRDNPAAPTPKQIRDGNAAWIDSAKVRRKWLAENLFKRKKAAPKQVTIFLAETLLQMPGPIQDALTGHHSASLFNTFTGRDASRAVEELATCSEGRRLWLALARVAAAYEYQIAGDNERKKTWRMDGGNWHCTREQAGHYLMLLIELGHTPTPIEHAVAHGVAYTGDSPSPTESPHHKAPAAPEGPRNGPVGAATDDASGGSTGGDLEPAA